MPIHHKKSSYIGDSTLFFENATSTLLGELRAAGVGWKGDLNRWQCPDRLRSPNEFYNLIMLLPGTQGVFTDDHAINCNVSYGNFILVLPHSRSLYAPIEGHFWSEMCLAFKGAAFDLLREESILSADRPVWHVDDADSWVQRFEQLLQAPRPNSPLAATREIARFMTFLLELLEVSDPELTNENPNDWFGRACIMLTNDLSRKVDLQCIAAELGMSYASFRRHFQLRAGLSPMKFRNERKCQMACQRLRESNISCWIIAHYLGFYDEAHFSHAFKQWTGMTPLQYRNNKI